MTRQSYGTIGAVAVLLIWAVSAQGAGGATYCNPVIDRNLADPAVILHEGVYYLYATGDVDGDNGYRVYTSKDLVHWERGPVVFRPGERHVWAPDLWRDPASGRFFLYYTASQTVGVAEGEGPLGPFTIRRRLFDRAIDAHLFQDDDGKLYLYYVQLPGFRIMVQPMAGPTEPVGEPKLVLRPESDWEKRAGHVTEGPWIIKHQGRYYLLYSGSGADTPDYAVGYATADHPLGPFTRAAHNPIVQRSPGLFGPGHGCAIRDGAGRWWHIYHQKRNDRVEWDRFICIDPLWFDQDGNLSSRATRGTPQPAPVPAAVAGEGPQTRKNAFGNPVPSPVARAPSHEPRATTHGSRPNIVLIISDDQAWGDYSFMGHPHIETPHLDRLAREGLTFTRSYVTAPLCRPSLATLVTGLHPHQHGIVGNDPPSPQRPRGKDWLVTRARLNEHLVRRIELVPTLPRMLAEKGYVSLQTGKWWEETPARGGFTAGMTHGDPARGGRHGDAGLTIGRQGLGAITGFIDRAVAEDRPFYVWYAPFLPHSPHTPPERLEQKYLPKAPTPAVAKYWAMCEWFDETCGELLAYLGQKGLRENTIVAYVCDNGWIQDPNRTNVFAPRSKQSPYEGGIRTPIMIRWPARLQPRFDTQTLVSSTDLVPTLLKACGLQPTAAMQGVDLLDARALAGRSSIYAAAYEHDIVDINRPAESLKYRVVINGLKKLILPNPARLPGAKAELYDVLADPHERNDLAATEPQTVRQLTQELDRWWTPPTPGIQEIEDPRVRRYVIPQRVVWQSPGAKVENTQALL
ncbi:MAG: hypothetical protein FJ280_29110, partial [Planctomycetes bacterium]|nr:hypothetical protein [Planctomycetota bacterium]